MTRSSNEFKDNERYNKNVYIPGVDDVVNWVCSNSNAYCVFRPRLDGGIEYHIEFLNEKNEQTGKIAFIEIRKRYPDATDSDKYLMKASKEYFEHWSKYSVPVIGIVFNPVKQDARWINISEYLLENPNYDSTGLYIIEAPKSQMFTSENSAIFEQRVLEYKNDILNSSLNELMELFFLGEPIVKEEVLNILFSKYKWTSWFCSFAHEALRTETNSVVLRLLIHLTSHYYSHSDRFYHKYNLMPREALHLSKLSKDLVFNMDISTVEKLINVIDDDVQRGSFGQTLSVILSEVEKIAIKLFEIITTNKNGNFRYNTLYMMMYTGHQELDYYNSLLEVEYDSGIKEILENIVESLKD